MEFYYDETWGNYEKAKSVCANAGGILFEAKNATVTKAVSDHFERFVKSINSRFWLGIHKNTDNGTYVYESDGMPIGWTNWANGKPSTSSREADQTGKEKCVVIFKNKHIDCYPVCGFALYLRINE